MGIDDSFHKGLKAYRDGNYQEAIQLFYNAVSDNEENHKAWNALGVTFSKMGKVEEALTCYDNALKYDPGNLSYEQNREQIVHKAFSRLPDSSEQIIPKHVPINYKRFIIPSIVLIFVILIAVFILFAAPFLLGSNPEQGEPRAVTPEIAPEETPVYLSPEVENTTTPIMAPDSAISDQPPESLEKPDESSFRIIGDLMGKYNNGLSEITFSIGIPEGKSPQYLPRIGYLWSIGMLDPVPVLPSNPATGTLKPGDTQLVTLQLPFTMQPRAGEKYRLEIRPVAGTGDPLILQSQIPATYVGGALLNPLSSSSISGSGSLKPGSQGNGTNVSSSSGQLSQNIILDGPLSGFYSGELDELTFTLRIGTTGLAQDLTGIQYFLTINNGIPVTITKAVPAQGTINPGEQQLVTVQIPEESRPRAGDVIRFEIKPDIGKSVVVNKMLSSAYKGGLI